MNRLRYRFLVSGVLLFLPLALLVGRALETVRAERALRHKIVAERVFDEAERELTTFLRGEEERPFEHYRHYYVAEGDIGTRPSLVRSPLADLPSAPFIVGYFQVDSGGVISTPLVDARLLPARVAQWGPSESLHRAVDEVRDVVRSHWKQVVSAETSPARVATDERPELDPAAASDYMPALNRGAVARKNRLSQNVFTSSMNVSDPGLFSAPAEPTIAPPRPVTVSLGPMQGLRVDERHFILYREASANESAYRQGLVLEVDRLIEWLQERIVPGSDLESRARLFPATADALEDGFRSSHFRLRHFFAEPFEGIEATLILAPLPEASGATYVHSLSALLVMAAGASLYGLYRMVSTQVSFAQKRQSFVSTVSHELRTPLTAIRMYAEMLRDGAVVGEEKRQHYYQVITRESERLTRLVNNVLELSNLERREPRPALTKGPLSPVLEEAVVALGPHARSEGFDVRLDAADDLPEVDYDRDGLLQVLFNLVDNAIKYAGTETRKEIRIEARTLGRNVELSVIDYGMGVGEEQLKHVFEPFYRGTSPTVAAKGSGMGLALVRGLVEAMGGLVKAETPMGRGFVVHILLKAHGRAK